MSKKNTWKIVLWYGSAILLGILIGPFLANLAGGLLADHNPASIANASDALPVVAISPDSPEATYICTPKFIGVFSNRVHVLCTIAAPGSIYYFSTPTSDSKNANRILSVMLTAKALAKNLQIYYNTTGNGSAYGCNFSDCRPITAIEIMN